MAYTDQRGLNRHSNVHIDTSVVSNSSMIPGPPFNKVASNPPSAVVAAHPVTRGAWEGLKVIGIDCDPSRVRRGNAM